MEKDLEARVSFSLLVHGTLKFHVKRLQPDWKTWVRGGAFSTVQASIRHSAACASLAS